MEYTILGRTGLKVSRLGLGGGGPSQLGQSSGRSEGESAAVIRQALAAGVNFIDTAEAYRTEGLIGQAIRGVPRHEVVLSTKKSTWSDAQRPPITPAQLRASLESSLQRLGTDYVDVYSLHAVEIEQYDYLRAEIVPAMQQLQREGKVRFLGITEAFHSDTQHIMLQRALQDDVWDVIMVGFNLLNQSARERVLAETLRRQIGIQIMFAVRLALSRPERLKEVIAGLIAQGQIQADEMDGDDPLGFVLQGGALSIPDAAYRFCRDEPGTQVILSGTGNPDHLRQNLASIAAPPLSPEVTARLRHLFRNVDSVSGQ